MSNTATPPEPAAPAELYPGHAADLARQAARNEAIRRANAEPLPGPLLDAFTGGPATVHGLQLRELVHWDIAALRKLESPLIRQLNGTVGEKVLYSDLDTWAIIFLFSRPARECAAILRRGVGEYRQAAEEAIGLTFGPLEVTDLLRACEIEFVRYFKTRLAFESTAPKREGSVFTPPPPAPTTGSAGGSTTSPR